MVSPVPMGLPAVILGGWSGDEGGIPGASLQASLTQPSQCPCEESVYHHLPPYRSRNEFREGRTLRSHLSGLSDSTS